MPGPNNTLDDFPAEWFTFLAFCESCGHSAPVERARVASGLSIPALKRRLRCSVCGAQEPATRIVYTGAGGFHYGSRPQ